MASVLRFHQFEVECVTSAWAALQKIENYKPDLFLIDSIMPVMSGVELGQKIRTLPSFLKTPIILATVMQLQNNNGKIHFDDILLKPVPVQKIIDSVTKLLK